MRNQVVNRVQMRLPGHGKPEKLNKGKTSSIQVFTIIGTKQVDELGSVRNKEVKPKLLIAFS